jgi:two-component system response regulator YesN
LVDDEPWSRELVKGLLDWGAMGLEIAAEAEDGQDALAFLRRRAADIVITDMKMPGTDGVGLLKSLQEEFPRIRVIVMSGFGDAGYMKQAIRARAVEYLFKPVDPAELRSALERSLRELEKENATRADVTVAGLPFYEKSALDRYRAFWPRLRDSLQGGAFEDGEKTISGLAAFLEETWGRRPSPGWASGVAADFSNSFREYMVSRGMDFSGESAFEGVPDCGDFAETAAAIRRMFRSVCLLSTALRSQRGRLDIGAVRAYLESHFLEELDLDALALRFFVNRDHLSRTFSAQAGETITGFITRLRMERAACLLADESLAIKDIAPMCAYEDLSYFYRVFRAHFGKTPAEFRESLTGDNRIKIQ